MQFACDQYYPTTTDIKNDELMRSQLGKKADVGETISFPEALSTIARSDRGEQIRMNNSLEEYALVISNLKIHETYTSGSCQNSKSLFHTLLHIYLVVHLGYNSMWVYSQKSVLNKIVKIQFKPMVKYWLASIGMAQSGTDSKSDELFTFNGANAIFTYSSTSSNNNGQTATGNAMVSFSGDIGFFEERSQWKPGSDAGAYRRLDESRVDTKPVRQIGTHGAAGSGIDEAGRDATYRLEPHCICEHCDTEIVLNPLGTLLKETQLTKPNGKVVSSYFAANGRPVKWFYHDEYDKEKSAYFGCPHCEGEISNHRRVKESYFKCVNTGLTAREILEFVDSDRYDVNEKITVFILLSPLLKDKNFNVAGDIISQGLKTTDPDDWCQQQLGLPSSSFTTKVTRAMIIAAIRAPMPKFEYNSWELPVVA